MNLVDAKDIAWKPDDLKEVEKQVAAIKGANAVVEPKAVESKGVFGKLKAVVRKAVDCCIELVCVTGGEIT